MIVETQIMRQKYSFLLTEKPYTMQKCSLDAIVLAKEILSKAREEAQDQCAKNMAKQIKELQH